MLEHDRSSHFAVCSSCRWIGIESDLHDDPHHECGKDECPECKAENFITCCYESYEAAEKYIDSDQDD